MRKLILFPLLSLVVLVATRCKQEEGISDNPLLSEVQTPYRVPPFQSILPEHFIPALEQAIEEQNSEIDSIVANEESPGFENTIVALDRSGRWYKTVSAIFNGLNSADATDEIKAISGDFRARQSAHRDNKFLNAELFNRIEFVYNSEETLELATEQESLLGKTYKSFVRNGANLTENEKDSLREINLRLTGLKDQFDKNLLTETNDFKLVIERKEDLSGLPDDVITNASEVAKEYGYTGKWVFTTHKPSMIPFLQFSEKREFRKAIYEAYCNRGNNNNQNDNKSIIEEMTKLRVEKAQLLGYSTYADYELDNRMAKTPENVSSFLEKVWVPALALAKKERAEMQEIIDVEGGNFQLASYDWWYYSEKLRKEKYALDENELKQYFELEKVRDGVFFVSKKLFGLQFEKIDDGIQKPHPDAEAYKVIDYDGSINGILYLDYYTRATKSQGAWCGTYKKQYKQGNQDIRPIVTIVCNFSKPSGNHPSLLSLDETLTLFHEFGHALHHLLSDVTYESISGTSVLRDFVELPSQIMENWALEPQILKHTSFLPISSGGKTPFSLNKPSINILAAAVAV